MRDTSWLLICANCCLWPALWCVAGWVFGRYKIQLQRPMKFEDRHKPAIRPLAAKDKVGYGSGK